MRPQPRLQSDSVMHPYLANPARFVRVAKGLTPWLLWPGCCWRSARPALRPAAGPAEQYQGDSVRIIYLHVPGAWLAVAAGPASRSPASCSWSGATRCRGDRPRAGGAGAVFSAICLATGSCGQADLGHYWQWDGRMTSMLILLFLYSATCAWPRREGARRGRAAHRHLRLAGRINIPIIAIP
jgi:heme exporter protein C